MSFRESCLRYVKQTLFNFACLSVTQNILKYLKQFSPVWKQKKPNVNKFLNNPKPIVWNNIFENSAKKKIRHLLIKENFGWNYVLTLAFVIVGLLARIKVWEPSTSDSSLVATVSSDSFYFASRDVLSSLDVKKVVL